MKKINWKTIEECIEDDIWVFVCRNIENNRTVIQMEYNHKTDEAEFKSVGDDDFSLNEKEEVKELLIPRLRMLLSKGK